MDHKVILITGCSSGFGFQTALLFARKGYKTYASVRNLKSEGAKKLQAIAQNENLSLEIVEIDVSKDASVTKGFTSIKNKEKRIDILVNNAGFGYLGPLESFSIDEIKEQYETNIFGMIRMVQHVLPLMREQKFGKIINVSSINGIISFPLWSVYSSSKFAIETMSEALRFEVAPFGIQVALVEPGSFITNFSKNVKYPKALQKEQSPYRELTERFFKNYFTAGEKARKSFVGKLIDSEKVVQTIYTIAEQNNPKLRNIVGIDAKMFHFLKNTLPENLQNRLLKLFFKW